MGCILLGLNSFKKKVLQCKIQKITRSNVSNVFAYMTQNKEMIFTYFNQKSTDLNPIPFLF